MKIAIFTNPEKENNELKDSITRVATFVGFEIDEENPDVVFACGGDGTLLRSVHRYIDKLDSVKFCGANFGHLGFFYDYEKDEIEIALKAILNNEMRSSKHKLIKGKIEENDGSITELYAVNEFRIENNLKPLIANVYIDGEPFEYFVGTGLTISSSVGSTAYNLTLGGAAVCCELESLQLTPIQPSTQCKCFKSSLILPVDKTIYLEGLLNNVLLGYDFIVKERLSFKSIAISTCDKEFVLLNKEGTNTLSKLKKLYN